MRTKTYRITFWEGSGQSRIQEVDAAEIGHVHDGTVSWLNFQDRAGEVLRVRSDAVERVERVGW